MPISAARTSQFGSTAVQGRDKPSPLELRCGNVMSGYFWTNVVFCILSQVRITHGELGHCSFPGSRTSTDARRYCCSLTESQYGLAPWLGCDSGVVFEARRGLPWSYWGQPGQSLTALALKLAGVAARPKSVSTRRDVAFVVSGRCAFWYQHQPALYPGPGPLAILLSASTLVDTYRTR